MKDMNFTLLLKGHVGWEVVVVVTVPVASSLPPPPDLVGICVYVTVCPYLAVVVITVAPLCVLVPPPPMTYPEDGQTPGRVSQFVIVCVRKTVVVPTPGLGLHVPVFGPPLPTFGFEVELQGPGTTIGVRAHV
jgi:hypothetical protein